MRAKNRNVGLVTHLKLTWNFLLLVIIGLLVFYNVYFFRYDARSGFERFTPVHEVHLGPLEAVSNFTGSGGWDSSLTLRRKTSYNCSVPGKFSSWTNGMVTQLGMPLERDCWELRANSSAEVERVDLMSQLELWRSTEPWESFALRFKRDNCTEIRQEFSNLFYVSEIEKEFPIAYILVVYTNPGQVLRFLKSIYRPHNLYCIHPDVKQGQNFSDYFKFIAKCIDNVFIVSKPLEVYYSHISYLDAQLHCMQDLMKYPATSWKYVINLTGREIPLKTNREIVESLVKLNGYTALILRTMVSELWRKRIKYKYRLNKETALIQKTSERMPKPPEGIILYKSLAFMAASREFVDFILHNPLSLQFHEYVSFTLTPDEHYYASLYALPQAKGARPPISQSEIPTVNGVLWMYPPESRCPGGHIIHKICIVTARDLSVVEEFLTSQNNSMFFFNKYFLELDPTPMDCAEEQLVRTNMKEYRQDCGHTKYHSYY